MKARKITKWVCGIAAVILAALLLLIGSFIYATRYRISDVDAATSPDGKHEIVFQAIGEPDWPFGYSHARIVLKRNGGIVTKRKFDVANDGGVYNGPQKSDHCRRKEREHGRIGPTIERKRYHGTQTVQPTV